jgi:hypothetical protein
MKYMGGSSNCILYTKQALTVPWNGWLLKLSLVHQLLCHTGKTALTAATLFLYFCFRHIFLCHCSSITQKNWQYFVTIFTKQEMMSNTVLRTAFYLCSLLFLQSISSQKCTISSTLNKPKHFCFIATIMVEPIYLKHEQQSQKNILTPLNGHATLHTIQQAIVLNRT